MHIELCSSYHTDETVTTKPSTHTNTQTHEAVAAESLPERVVQRLGWVATPHTQKNEQNIRIYATASSTRKLGRPEEVEEYEE